MKVYRHQIAKVISALPAHHSYQETAQIMGISVPEIKRNELSAIRKIMEAMLAYYHDMKLNRETE